MSCIDARCCRRLVSRVSHAYLGLTSFTLASSLLPSHAAADGRMEPLCRGVGRYIEIAFWPVLVLHFAYPSIATWLIEYRVNRQLRMLGSGLSYRRPLTVSVFLAAFALIMLTALSVVLGAVVCLVRRETLPLELAACYTLLLIAFTHVHVARVARKEVANMLASVADAAREAGA